MIINSELGIHEINLLQVLQNDGKISNQDLAEATAMSTSACWRHVKVLEEKGVIQGYTALVDPEACGLKFHAMVHIVLSRNASTDLQAFINAVLARPEVLDCFATSGDADYHLRVRCPDIHAYNKFLETFLFAFDAVSNVKTNLIMRQIKHETKLPL